jgi:succinyl-diaminopimelate desuccinylase
MNKTELLALIEADEQKHLQFLQSFIRAPSPNPPGDTVQAAQVIREYLSSHDIDCETIAPQERMPNILSECTGGAGDGPRIIMNGHIDVFPVGDAEGWTYCPYSGHNDGTYIHGRGGVDMKAGTAASIIAFTYLYLNSEHLRGKLSLAIVSDEETGGRWGSKYLLEHEPRIRGDCMINAEPGGLQSIRFGEKGTLRLTFTVRTVGGHGAYTHAVEGANRIMLRLIHRLDSVQDLLPDLDPDLRRYLEREDVRRVADEIMGTGAADSLLKVTLNIGTIHGGLKVNMIPERCVMEADIRLPLGMDRKVVLDHIDTILKDFSQVTLQVQEAASNPSNHCSEKHPLLKAIATNAEAVIGRKPLAIPGLGATDAKFWRYRGIPAYELGVSPATMAATNERVEIREFLAVVKIHALAIWDYLGGPSVRSTA